MTGYGVLAMVVLAVAFVNWRLTRAGRRAPAGVEVPADQVAYVSGGPGWVLWASLAGLRRAGVIDADSQGRLTVVGPLPANAPEMDAVVHETLRRHKMHHRELVADPRFVSSLARLAASVVDAGWVLRPVLRLGSAVSGVATLGVAVVGMARLVTGSGSTVETLIVTLICTLAGGIWLLKSLERPSRAGVRLVQDCIDRMFQHLGPGEVPQPAGPWALYDPTGAALHTALNGPLMMCHGDPSFAAAAGIPCDLRRPGLPFW